MESSFFTTTLSAAAIQWRRIIDRCQPLAGADHRLTGLALASQCALPGAQKKPPLVVAA
jgi:hypothetical protein